jgi:hypothetical protein
MSCELNYMTLIMFLVLFTFIYIPRLFVHPVSLATLRRRWRVGVCLASTKGAAREPDNGSHLLCGNAENHRDRVRADEEPMIPLAALLIKSKNMYL